MTGPLASELAQDFLDLLRYLNQEEAEYLVVGGYAVNFYGYSRATEDLDVWINTSRANATRVWKALEYFGLPPGIVLPDLRGSDEPPPTGFRFGRRPISVDLLTSIEGVEFGEAWKARRIVTLDEVKINMIGLEALLINKRSTGRLRDLADAAELTREPKTKRP